KITLQLAVSCQHCGERGGEVGAGETIRERCAAVRQQDPAAASVDREGSEYALGSRSPQELVEACLERRCRSEGFQPDPADSGRRAQDRRPRPQMWLLNACGAPDPLVV